jgi:hypothetical protein
MEVVHNLMIGTGDVPSWAGGPVKDALLSCCYFACHCLISGTPILSRLPSGLARFRSTC